MKLRYLLPRTNGIFSNMPNIIWGTWDASYLDRNLRVNIGGMEASPLTLDFLNDEGELDVDDLASFLFQKYELKWRRTWNALNLDYETLVTSFRNEKTTVQSSGTERVDRELDAERIRDLDRDEVGSQQEDISVDTEGSDVDAGTQGVNDTETRALELTSTGTVTKDSSREDAETDVTESEQNNTGTTKTDIEHGVYGIGGSGVSPESLNETLITDARKETQDVSSNKALTSEGQESESRNLKDEDKGTVTKVGSTNINNRRDSEQLAVTDRSYSDTKGIDENERETNGENEAIDRVSANERVEEFETEGSSPLRTAQALIQEDIDLFALNNFTEILLNDVRKELALWVWRKPTWPELG